jgi:Outer membrane protein beta-barrel domain
MRASGTTAGKTLSNQSLKETTGHNLTVRTIMNQEDSLRITQSLFAVLALLMVLEGSAGAQAQFTASIGNAFGGDVRSKKTSWALAIGGSGARGIGSELEFSETRKFFETPNGMAHGKVVTLIPSIFVAVPVNRVRPYAIFGFGFIRQRTEQSSGGILSDLSDDDIGYSIGGGVTFQFARHAGVRADLRHFKVRTSDGLSFQRFLVGIVLGG